MVLARFWNKKTIGMPGALYQFLPAMYLNMLDKLSTKLQRLNILKVGDNVTIQCKTIIRNPNNITFGDNTHIGREVEMSSELSTASLSIGTNSQISTKCYIDYTGNLVIGEHCTLSEEVMIQTHSHGLNPKSDPIPLSLEIQDNVWIGARATVLHNVNIIGENSIVAASAVVTKNVPANVIVAGNPATIIKELNVE